MTHFDPSGPEFFEQKYMAAEDGDPWRFATSPYELQRYESILSSLSGNRYHRAFEPGCSVGVLTRKLAALCDQVVSCDFSQAAVDVARSRCHGLSNVTISCEAFSDAAPFEDFDLIVLCEIGYYFDPQAWQRLIEAMVSKLTPGATVLASHWLGTSQDHLQAGDTVQEALDHPLLRPTFQERHKEFRINHWVRTG